MAFPRRSVPTFTYVLIALNIMVWLLELSRGDHFINGYSAVPLEITHNTDLIGTQTVQAGGQSIPIELYADPGGRKAHYADADDFDAPLPNDILAGFEGAE